MLKFSALFANIWPRIAAKNLFSSVELIIFTFLDLLDFFLCIFYRFLDEIIDLKSSPCYCENRGKQGIHVSGDDEEDEISETLYGRKSIFRDLGLVKMKRNRVGSIKKCSLMMNRWSDCSCESCVSWQQNEDYNLHVVVMEPPPDMDEACKAKPAENVIFLHGFLSSSSFWTETVFPNLSDPVKQNYRLFALDLLGFGRSPKPSDCFYTLKDNLGMIEKSVINPFQLKFFHLVGHSMGCIIALALAAKYPNSVKSITLIAPPYFPSFKEKASLTALNRLAERKLWPPLLFGSAVMSWYEHLGRSACFLICRNHRKWEWILRLLTWRRDLHFMVIDLTKHTHHSAWHTMHNVICGGAKLMDEYLEAVNKSGMFLTIIQGEKDQVVPLECCRNMKLKVPLAEIMIISNVDHCTVILGREMDFTRKLEHIWFCSGERHKERAI